MLAQKQLFFDLNDDNLSNCRPLLKWAGGKTQLLDELIPMMPKKYGRYIEPFFGGGLYFLQYAHTMV